MPAASLPASDLQQLVHLFQARRFDAMEQLARRLVRQHPGAGIGWKALGTALQAQGRDAVDALQRAATLLPGDAESASTLVEAHLTRGHDRMKAGQVIEAAASYREAGRLNPAQAHAHACLGVALQQLGELEDAVPSLQRAVALRPDLADSHFCLGSSLLALGRADEAVTSLRRVLDLRPGHASAHANLGNALKALGRVDEALPAYRLAIDLQPDVPLHHANLGAALREQGDMLQALASYQRVLDLDPGHLGAASDRLFIQNYLPRDAAPGRLAEARRFGALAAARARPFTRWHERRDGERLRVGFVSADLREHPVGYFLEGVLAVLARDAGDRIECRVYANSEVEDDLTRRLKPHCHRWTCIARDDDATAAARIHADAIDVLVDLSGHTAGNRLPMFAWRPAPRQASWLGYCATTGVEAIDVFLSDPWIAPPGTEAAFTETLRRLPETFLCFTPPALALAVGPLPARDHGAVTFGCFNKLNKLGDEVIAC